MHNKEIGLKWLGSVPSLLSFLIAKTLAFLNSLGIIPKFKMLLYKTNIQFFTFTFLMTFKPFQVQNLNFE